MYQVQNLAWNQDISLSLHTDKIYFFVSFFALLLVPHRDQQESTKRGSLHQRISVFLGHGRRALRPFFLQGVPCGRPPRTLRGLDGAG